MSGTARRLEQLWLRVFYFFCCSIQPIFQIGVAANVSDLPISQATALMSFKRNSVSNDPNSFLKSWNNLETANPCSWKGITCSSDGIIFAVNLSNAGLTGQLQMNDLTNLHNLRYLDLSRNNFSGNFSNLEFRDCSSLVFLNASQNTLGEFPASLTNCKFLEKLDLSDNELDGKLSGSVLGRLRNLKYLSLAGNQFSGKIPSELNSIWGTLKELDLSGNRLSGKFLDFCSSLQSLNLGNNEFSGNFFHIFSSSLPNLKSLRIPFNNITGSIPLALTNFSNLQVLDLSSNAFFGNIPSGLCSSQASSPLKEILLAGNFLSGEVPSELGNCKNLSTIDFSFNDLSGSIPLEIWTLPYLSNLILGANNIHGEIPENICTTGGNLRTLILNNNIINGTIPVSLENCEKLEWVSLSHNRLTGEVPAGIGNLQNLMILELGNNLLTGEIPPGLGECQSLVWLSLNNNSLTGSIPTQLAKQAGSITGRPVSKSLVYFRVSDRAACRSTGQLFEFEGVRISRLADVVADGCTYSRAYVIRGLYSFTNNGSMIYLDLSYNFLSGAIPESLSSMTNLLVLSMRNNKLSGSIPYNFGSLKDLGVLDISHNHLAGNIPNSISKLSILSDIDFSYNDFSGTIPQGGQLTTFAASTFSNNPGLCGYPLYPCSPVYGPGRETYSPNSTGETEFEWTWVIVSLGYASGVCVGVVFGNVLFQRKQEWFVETFLGARLRNRWK